MNNFLRISRVFLGSFTANSFDLHDLNMTKGGYGRIQAYAKSKLANILFTKELHRRFKGTYVQILLLYY